MPAKKLSTDIKKILNELISSQRDETPIDRKLRYKDLCRITKYIATSIFDQNDCCLWDGYITNLTNISKGTYINFYFRNKKVALHRLLYENFVEIMDDDEYLKYTCENRGKCCNVKHMIKYKYNNEDSKHIKHHEDDNINNNKDLKSHLPRAHQCNFTITFE